jgi:hypothetical protein
MQWWCGVRGHDWLARMESPRPGVFVIRCGVCAHVHVADTTRKRRWWEWWKR